MRALNDYVTGTFGRIAGALARQRRMSEHVAMLGLLTLAAAYISPLAVHAGSPAFQHDWTWPLWRQQKIFAWTVLISAWNPAGVGSFNPVPTLNPAQWLQVALPLVLGAKASLITYAWAAVSLAMLGAFRICTGAFRLPPATALFASALLGSSTLVFSKLAAGQIGYVAGMGCFVFGLPYVVGSFLRADSRQAAIGALWFAMATIQLQFLVFCELTALVVLASHSFRPRLQWLIVAAGTATFAVPSVWFLLHTGPAGAGISPPNAYWEYSQSRSVANAAAMLGYADLYSERAVAALGSWALPLVRWSGVALTALAVVVGLTLRNRAARALSVLCVVGVLWSTGVRGPLAFLWVWLFQHAVASYYLREFYHASVLIAVAQAVLSAVALGLLRARPVAMRAALGCVAVLISGLPTFSLGLWRTVPYATPPTFRVKLASLLRRPQSRVMMLPIHEPLAIAGDRVGGDDAFAWVDDTHLDVYSYYLPSVVWYPVVEDLRGNDAPISAFVPRLGVEVVVLRKDMRSLTNLLTVVGRSLPRTVGRLPSYARTPIDAGTSYVKFTPFPLIGTAELALPLPPDLGSLQPNPRVVYLDAPGTNSADQLPPYAASDNPQSGWVSYRDADDFFPRGLATPTLGIVTARGGSVTEVRVTHATDALVWAPHGVALGGRIVRATRYRRVSIPSGLVRIRALGPAAIGEIGEAAVPGFRSEASVVGRRIYPWLYRGVICTRGRGVLVLRESFDRGWHLQGLRGMRVLGHVRADGFANSWIVLGHGCSRVSAEFGPQQVAWLLLLLSAALLALVVAIIFGSQGSVG